jgi:hypothetical protein
MTVTTWNEAQLFHCSVITVWHNPTKPYTLVSYWQCFTIFIAEIRLLNSSCCRTGGWSCMCYVTGQKIIVQWARPAQYVRFPLHFLTAATPCVCCTLYGGCCAQGSYLMAVSSPLPANSLMQSARHVTAHVHIHFWISKYEYVREAT